MAKITVRNKQTRDIKRKFLLDDPLNWHVHPENQRDALAAIFREVGFVGYVLVRPAEQRNRWYIVDGHERVQHFGPDDLVPCCVLDVDEAEARKLLAAYDSLGYLAGIDRQQLDELVAGIEFDEAELAETIRGIGEIDLPGNSERQSASQAPTNESGTAPDQSGELTDRWEVLIHCDSEGQQKELLKELEQRGFQCRALTS